jgi:hypothetical protein
MRVSRTDRAMLGAVKETPQGGISVPATISRTGVLPYSDGTNKWSEYRPESEVFAKDSLESLRAAPVTVGHPDHLVTAQTYRADMVGHQCDDVRRDGNCVATNLVVQDAAAVADIKAKKLRDISAGYTCDIDPTPGVAPDGTRYDAVQRNIQFNHIALLPPGQGRSGPTVALRMDGAAFEVPASEVPPVATPPGTAATAAGANQQTSVTASGSSATSQPVHVSRADTKDQRMLTIKIAGREFKLDAADAPAMQAAADGMGSELAAVKAALVDALQKTAQLEAKMAADKAAMGADAAADAAAGEPADDVVLDAKQAPRVAASALGIKLDGKQTAGAVRKLVADKVTEAATAITALRADAAKILGEKFDATGKSPDAIKREAIAKVFPSVKLDSLNAQSTDTLFAAARDASKASTTTHNDSLGEANRAALGLDADGKPITARADESDPEATMVKNREAQAKAARERATR